MKMRVLVATAVLLLGVALVAPTWAQEGEVDGEEERVVTFGIELITEYDDNLNLGADTGDTLESPKDDFVIRAKPRLKIDYPHRDHEFKLDFGGILREGSDSELSESNLRGRASVELNFASGLEIELYDFYLETEFDQALFFVETPDLALVEPGISETDSNTLGFDIKYVPKRRLTAEASYSSTDQHFVFGTPNSPPDDRDVEVFSGSVEFPLSLKWVGVLAVDSNEHQSVQQPPRNFDELQYLAGLRWERTEQLAFFLEAGVGEADFADTPGVEFDNTVWILGTEIDFTDDSSLELSFGQDLYGETAYEILLDRTRKKDAGLRLLIRKSSQNSFASETLGRIFEATIVGLKYKHFFDERFSFGAEARYFDLQANEGELMQDDTTWLGRVEVDYTIRPEWMRLGGFAQISTRDSNNPVNEFENTRIGVTLKLVRGAQD